MPSVGSFGVLGGDERMRYLAASIAADGYRVYVCGLEKLQPCKGAASVPLCELAEKNSIPYQREVLTFGGTDTASMQLTGLGCMAGALSIPTRYVHSGVELCDMGDLRACIDLAEKYIIK